MKKNQRCWISLVIMLSIMLLGRLSVAAAEKEEINYGDIVDELAYVEIEGVDYGCVFSPESKKVTIYWMNTKLENVEIPTYITYYGQNYKVDGVCEIYYIIDDYASTGFAARKSVRTLSVPEIAELFDIEGSKWPHLEKIIVPAGVKNLRLNGYLEAKVVVSPQNKRYKTAGSGLYSKNGKTLIHSFGRKHEIKVKKGTQTISSKAFNRNTWVEKVTMANTVKVIKGGERAASAFGRCLSLRQVVCSSNLEKIGKWSFVGCKRLSKVYINNPRKAPKIAKTAFDNTKAGIKFYVKNQAVAKDLEKQLKKTRARKFKIIVANQKK